MKLIDIRRLRTEAGIHQDWAQVKICEVALGEREPFGHWTVETARAECERVILENRGRQ